ncbi:uncharacterized protein LOC105176505 [Sesamum indicum]|uniref:Uncharacterized protein LOC105176505 n=1 Tax=Sesamum indicum TaxID=4182 RepID=A0A8M8VCW0_SESIN|nr:uncharacterized protein LOC105176505 [Sesamum indicum]
MPGPSNIQNFSIPSNILDSSTIIVPEMSIPNTRVSSFDVPQEVGFPDRIHMSTQSLCNIQGPRFTSTTTMTSKASCPKMAQSIIHHHDHMQTASQSQSTNSNSRQLRKLDLEAGQQTAHHLNIHPNQDYYNINCDVDRPLDHQPQHHNQLCQNTLFDDLLPPEVNITIKAYCNYQKAYVSFLILIKTRHDHI